MKRRKFLKTGSLITAPLLLNGVPVFAENSTGNAFFDFLAQTTYGCGRILVIIQMNGGNDGLNTIIPVDKYANLSAARPNIILPEASILPLNNNPTTGMHPALAELRDLYDNGKVTIVQGVSYPNPNFSHFRATDIWFSASDSNVDLDTGWLGRSLDTQYPNYPADYPNTDMPDPLAVQIGSTLPFSLQGPAVNMGYNVTNPASLLNVINATTDPAPNNDYGRELTFLRLMKDQSNAYTGRIQAAYNAQATLSALYPASGNSLADQLKIVARLIGGGLQTPVYIVNHPNSHDTHVDQVVAGNTATGSHANILGILSKAINAFQNDITLMGKALNVTGMTFSEFGRRIINNASMGTDHGVGAPVLFFGAAVNGGMIGTSPNIPATSTVSSQVPMQHDFRQLYSTVMQKWFCLSASQTQTVLGSDFSQIPIFSATALPLEDITLTGQYYNGESKLNFKVEDNTHYEKFTVEFSANGLRYDELQQIARVSLNDLESYTYDHRVTAPKMYYRIKGLLLGGRIKYSNTVLLRTNDKLQLISVYPNPVVNNQINVKLFEKPETWVDITIYDLIGAKVYYNRFNDRSSLISFRVPPSFARDTHYIIEVKYGATVAREQIIFR
ncbi:MAG: DUF1501 domain-containing protein [Chitinophagaceae bacterium]|nr:DUF1501 domain-containing protein [Chitinophagaceae bacterium]